MFEIRGNRVFLGDRMLGWMTHTSDGKRIYVSPRNRQGITPNSSGHRMEQVLAGCYGMNRELLDFLKLNQFVEIHLKIGTNDETKMAPLTVWEKLGIERQFKGFENQMFLHENYMISRKVTLAEGTR